MCGIAGFWGPSASSDALTSIARAMGEASVHRGPDGRGEFALPAVGLGLAHRRLAIIDLTEAGHQPMHSASGRWTVVFNGEIYNYLVARAELEKLRGGFAWRGHSDTELLVEALETWGVEGTLARCNGMFAFAAWDHAAGRLILARDRLGEKPLYYGTMPDGTLLFGSELRALYAHPSWRGAINRDAVGMLMHYNSIPAPFSVWQGVAKLPPAHWLEVRERRASAPRPYWSLRDAMQTGAASRTGAAGDDSLWVDRLETVLGEVVEQQMLSDVPLGAFLSGGIDSSLVVAMMQKRASQPVKTFTIGFREDAFDEARFAREVAAHLGTEHHEFYLTGGDALGVVPKLAEIYDEPFSDSSQVPTWLVSHFARQHVTVALSGDAGDELFAGYTRYLVGDGFWRRASKVPYPLRRAIAAGIGCMPSRAWDGLGAALGPACPKLLRNSPGDKFSRIARMLRERSPAGFYDELISHWKDPATLVPGARLAPLELAEAAARAGLSDIEFMQAHDTLAYLPNDILVKVDRAAMAVSLETRAPFLDRRVLEFAWTVPESLKVREGNGKWLMRELLARHVPRALFERPKQGFGVPLAGWLRGPLREWAESLLAPSALAESGLFDPAPIRKKWAEHLAGQGHWHYYLWDVLMFQAWFQRYRAQVS
ncbi:asparagine synthase (glutamine-hydrolyzing) [Niveibacterium sp. 24ML]|uniref:asparagine synthase (glutamine-hydrolyzing) n=1 Tax=Niveibacterium sp. 24ML TaxID=2985512 RepID=UPI00227127D8|nr:asparagine synthase (glutamine-hydrolyzing) [Niveibacterium sp. 24ML]MCX9154891.1 asparagine synthase (glutamine-hydrolyzing) [Niveibacterium sp. 24ML]